MAIFRRNLLPISSPTSQLLPYVLTVKNHDRAGRTKRIEELHLKLHCPCKVKDHVLGPCAFSILQKPPFVSNESSEVHPVAPFSTEHPNCLLKIRVSVTF
jgi:hypothetical protein